MLFKCGMQTCSFKENGQYRAAKFRRVFGARGLLRTTDATFEDALHLGTTPVSHSSHEGRNSKELLL